MNKPIALITFTTVLFVLASFGCSTGAKSQPPEPAAEKAGTPPSLEAETQEDFDDPPLLENCYGLEKGDVGIEECDQWVKRAGECAQRDKEHDAFLALVKQKQLLWKLGVRKAGDDEVQRGQVRDQCRKELSALGATLTEQGCSEPKE